MMCYTRVMPELHSENIVSIDHLTPVRTIRDGLIIHAAIESYTGNLATATLCALPMTHAVRCTNDRTPLSCERCMLRAREWAGARLNTDPCYPFDCNGPDAHGQDAS